MKVNREHFPSRLRELMDSNGATMYSIAEIVNMSAATISRYLSGSMAPKTPTIESIARYYNVNPAWLLGYDVEKYIQIPTAKSEKIYVPSEKEIYRLAAHGIGHDEKLSDEELTRVKMAIRIALEKHNK